MLKNFNAYRQAKELLCYARAISLSEYAKDQLVRASYSIVLNIAEGSGRRTPADQAKFYSNALGSLRECEAIFDVEQIQNPKINELMSHLGAVLFRLSRPNREKHPKQTETETI